jgi:transcription initiation factor TFIIIB Brf1 subunit/transcription initiation factor TFIIB
VIACPVLQTGRKPSGICGAALYIAALSHGYDYTKADIVSANARTDLII